MTISPREALLVGILVTILIFSWTLHPQGTGIERIVDNGDSYLHTWNLWWVKTAVFERVQSPYFTDYNGYPGGIPLTFHQLILPLGVLSAPLLMAGMTAGQILVIWQYLFAIVGFSGMYYLVRRWNPTKLGPFVAGLYFVLLPIYWQNLPRPDSLSYVLFPWIVLSLYWAGEGRWFRLLVPVLLGGIVVLLSPYFGAGLGLLWLCTLPFTGRLELNFRRTVLVAPLTFLWTAFHWGKQVLTEPPHLPSWRILEGYSADLSAWLLPPPQLWWISAEGAWWAREWLATEPSLYAGWFALGLVLVGLFRFRSPRVRWSLGVALLFFVVSLGPGLTLLGETWLSGWFPYGWGVQFFPFLKAFRAPLRFGFFVLFFLSLGIGVFYPEKGALRWLLGFLIVLELVRVPVKTVELPAVEPLRKVKERVQAPALVPVPLTGWPTEVQYAQTVHEKKLTVVGISHAPGELWRNVGRNPVLEALYQRQPLPKKGWSDLRKIGYGGVIFHHTMFPDRLEGIKRDWLRTLRDRLGPPEITSERFLLFKFEQEPDPEDPDPRSS